MSFRRDDVVVPFSTFLERRERLGSVTAALREPGLSERAVKSPPAMAPTAVTGETQSGDDQSVPASSTDVASGTVTSVLAE
jgi:hypothetical protein